MNGGDIERPRAYLSKTIQDRRRRIIQETVKMINEGGLGKLSLSEVSRRAGVARRTIYYGFETRDALIMSAMDEQSDRLEQGAHYQHEHGSLGRVIERICY